MPLNTTHNIKIYTQPSPTQRTHNTHTYITHSTQHTHIPHIHHTYNTIHTIHIHTTHIYYTHIQHNTHILHTHIKHTLNIPCTQHTQYTYIYHTHNVHTYNTCVLYTQHTYTHKTHIKHTLTYYAHTTHNTDTYHTHTKHSHTHTSCYPEVKSLEEGLGLAWPVPASYSWLFLEGRCFAQTIPLSHLIPWAPTLTPALRPESLSLCHPVSHTPAAAHLTLGKTTLTQHCLCTGLNEGGSHGGDLHPRH